MEFRLTYRGPLASNGSLQQKQELRRALHPQLSELWRQSPLREHSDYLSASPPEGVSTLIHLVEPFTFVALVSSRIRLIAELEILLLRPQEPGKLLGHGGDLDNRLKTLLDALRLPTVDEIPKGDTPGADENPFHCLLEDDALVSKLSVTSDRLLGAVPKNHVDIIMHVRTRPTIGTWGNISLIG